MPQKVISVNVLVRDTEEETGYKEHEFPKLKAALDEGYTVKEVVPIKASDNLYIVNITFVLEKV